MNFNNQQHNSEHNQNGSQNKKIEAKLLSYTKNKIVGDINRYDRVIAKNISSLECQKNNQDYQEIKNLNVVQKRINSFDSTILEESAYNILDNVELIYVKKIENIEKDLKSIDEKIEVAKVIDDENSYNDLLVQRDNLLQEIQNIKEKYKTENKTIYSRFIVLYAKMLKFPQSLKKDIKKKIFNFLKNSTFIKRFTPFVHSITLRDTIKKLNKINNSIDELVKMQSSYGEQDDRYKKLVNHLSKASSLHSQISKEFNSSQKLK